MSQHWRGILLIVLLAMFVLSVAPPPARAQGDVPEVVVLTFRGQLTGILVTYVENGLKRAEERGAEAVVILLDTPGGSVGLMDRLVQDLINAPVPVIVYVSPPGAHASSAGTFVTLAAHVAAMAPNTTIGAASPVGPGGEEIPETLRKKIENTLAEDIEQLAQRRGEKAAEWARQAVLEAVAADAEEALELGLIDIIAEDLDDLLQRLDGREVTGAFGTRTLRTANARPVDLPPSPIEDFLNRVISPSLALLLITLGVQLLIAEFAQPGGYVAGIAGTIALILGIYALGVLDANYAGLALIALAFLLFLLDIKAPTHGVLTLGGIISFIAGAALLFYQPFVEIPWGTIMGLALLTAAFFAFIIAKVLQAHKRRPWTGMEALIGQEGEARTDLDPNGMVYVEGLWQAETQEPPIPAGSKVNVVGYRGLRLIVQPVDRHSVPTASEPRAEDEQAVVETTDQGEGEGEQEVVREEEQAGSN